MRNVKVLCAAFLAVLALGAVSVATANASKWLENEAEITSPQTTTTTDKSTLLGKSFFGFVETEVGCSGKLIGTVGTGAAGQTTELEDTKGHKGGNGVKLECTVGTKNGGCMAGETAIIQPTHLPWFMKLVAGTKTPRIEFTGTGGEPGFTISCNGHTNTCEGNFTSDEVVNSVSGGVFFQVLKAQFNKCTEAGTKLEFSFEGTILLTNGAVLRAVN